MDAHKRRVGQASVETVVILAIVLLVLIAMSYVIFQRFVRTTDLKIYITGKRIANSLADNINTVKSSGDGFSLKATLPYRMFSTNGYQVYFYGDEPTVFVRGDNFVRSDSLIFSAPIATVNLSCLLQECSHACNTSESETCLLVNRSLDFRIVNYANRIYLTPQYNLQQGVNRWEVRPFTGRKLNEDIDVIAKKVRSGYVGFGLIFLYNNEIENGSLYLVFNNFDFAPRVHYELNDTVGNLTVYNTTLTATGEPELNLTKDHDQANWLNNAGKYSHGIIKLNSNEIRMCITIKNFPPPANRPLIFLNRDYEEIKLNKVFNPANREEICLTYP